MLFLYVSERPPFVGDGRCYGWVHEIEVHCKDFVILSNSLVILSVFKIGLCLGSVGHDARRIQFGIVTDPFVDQCDRTPGFCSYRGGRIAAPQGGTKLFTGLLWLTLVEEYATIGVASTSVIGIQLRGLVQVGLGGVQITLPHSQHTPYAIRKRTPQVAVRL